MCGERGGAISKKQHRTNREIRVKEVRLIDERGEQMGIYPTREAFRVAQERGLDLVEVAPQANPPVCRLLDYGKYLYERDRREREARRANKPQEIKEIQISPKEGEHDLAFKFRRARKFLEEGAKVRVRIRFRGREITHKDLAIDLMARAATELGDVSEVDERPRMEGRHMLMMLAPQSSDGQ